MKAIHNEFIMHDLDKYNTTIDRIISELNILDNTDMCFDIKLILVEALTNAFIHGNGGDVSKTITLRYTYSNGNIRFEVEDMGKGFENVAVSEYLSDLKLLDNCGRGLFLINCIADSIEFKNNIMIVNKKLM